MKKVIYLIFTLIIVISINLTASALTSVDGRTLLGVGITNKNMEIEKLMFPSIIDALEVCDGKTYHAMLSMGLGTVYIGTYPDYSNCAMSTSPCWQCTGCYLVMVTTGNIPLGAGNYAHEPFSEPITGYGCTMWTNQIYYTSTANIQVIGSDILKLR